MDCGWWGISPILPRRVLAATKGASETGASHEGLEIESTKNRHLKTGDTQFTPSLT